MKLKRFIVWFYIIGAIGTVFPLTRDLFLLITPFALLMNIGLLAKEDKNRSIKAIIVFALIYLLGFFVEMLGVNSGVIFGEYHYGESLGLKLMNTPLMIGINWLMLSYLTMGISRKLVKQGVLKVLLASSLMLVYDLLIEQNAPFIDYWYWQNDIIPLQNYIAWFSIALIFNTIIQITKVSVKNSLSSYIFLAQIMFFLIIYIFKIILT